MHSRGSRSFLRCGAVAVAVTGTSVGVVALAVPVLTPAIDLETWQAGRFDVVLLGAAGLALLVCAGWLWLVTALTLVDIARDRVGAPTGLTRRLVLTACGVAVVAGVSAPAVARDSTSLNGLPLPDRAVGVGTVSDPSPREATDAGGVQLSAAGPSLLRVRAGDSLWSLAASQLGPDASLADIDAQWRRLYARNRPLVGADPDLIRPGQRLVAPTRPQTDAKEQHR